MADELRKLRSLLCQAFNNIRRSLDFYILDPRWGEDRTWHSWVFIGLEPCTKLKAEPPFFCFLFSLKKKKKRPKLQKSWKDRAVNWFLSLRFTSCNNVAFINVVTSFHRWWSTFHVCCIVSLWSGPGNISSRTREETSASWYFTSGGKTQRWRQVPQQRWCWL